MKQESNRQKTMEDIDGGLHPAVDGQQLDERRNYNPGSSVQWGTLFFCFDQFTTDLVSSQYSSSFASLFSFSASSATLPGAWRYRVSAETGRPGVSKL